MARMPCRSLLENWKYALLPDGSMTRNYTRVHAFSKVNYYLRRKKLTSNHRRQVGYRVVIHC